MKQIVDKNIFERTWPIVKYLAEEQDYSLSLAKLKVCRMYGIPESKHGGFQKVKEFVEWKHSFLNRKVMEKKWIK